MKFNRLLFALAILLGIFGCLFLLKRCSLLNLKLNRFSALIKPSAPKPIWMNVFIHGTVGSAFFILNMAALAKDDFANTNYKKMTKSLRTNHAFYQDQPILGKGLVKITPGYEFDYNEQNLAYGAYPILKAFDDVWNWTYKSDIENIYYLFGWDGYISQKKRRMAGLRCLNQIITEINRLKKLGFDPKVRILAHSHGGNVALNIAGFLHMMNPGEMTDEFYSKFESGQAIKNTFENLLEVLPESEIVRGRKNQKQFDHIPEQKNLFIDEVILLGTPIQDETSLFVMSPYFRNVYNFYSDGDLIQGIDFLSTSKKQSAQRVEFVDTASKNFFQTKVFINQLSNNDILTKVSGNKLPTSSWWQVLLGLKDTSRKTADPTHKELWFIVAKSDSPYNFLRPVPLVCFYPIIHKLQNKFPTKDVILEIAQKEECIEFSLHPYDLTINDCNDFECKESFPLEKLHFLQEKIYPWTQNKNQSKAMKGLMDGVIKLHRKVNI